MAAGTSHTWGLIRAASQGGRGAGTSSPDPPSPVAAPGEPQVLWPRGLFCSRPGGSKRESVLPTWKRKFWGPLEGAVPGPSCLLWPWGSPARASRVLSQMSSGMSQLIGLKEKGLPHIAASCTWQLGRCKVRSLASKQHVPPPRAAQGDG